MMRIVVHIERVTLRGVASGHRTSFARALQKELTRQLSASPPVRLTASSINAERLVTLPVRQSGSDPGQLGRGVARGIARSLKA